MKSIKPGRGPSGLSFIGSIVMIVFGIFWTVIAFGMAANMPFGAAKIFPFFGIIFIILGIVIAIYNYKNATGKNRYSILDITDGIEEGDPSDKWIKDDTKDRSYCPYCGEETHDKYVFCPKCGKSIEKDEDKETK